LRARRTPSLILKFVDLEAVVEIGIVDQPFPANSGTRLLEIDPHHDQQIAGQAVGFGLEPARILDCSIQIVDRAGPDHDEQAVISAEKNPVNRLARLERDIRGERRSRELPQQVRRRNELLYFLDADIVDMNLDRGRHGATLLFCRLVDPRF